MRGRGGQSTTRKGVLGDVVLRLGMMGVVMLLSVVGVMILGLKLGNLHAKPLVALTAIHHDMLLMTLAVHSERVQRG